MIWQVEIPFPIYQEIIREAVKASSPSEGIETIGLLVGRFEEEKIKITESVYVGTGTATHVTISDYSFITELLPPERLETGESIVGWWHSHPSGERFLSVTDVSTHTIYQQLEKRAIALLVLPPAVEKGDLGMVAYQLSELEFPQEVPILLT